MKSIGKVIDTFSADINSKGLPRPKVDSIDLKTGYGIINDKFAGKELHKTVMIVGIDSYKLALENGISMEYGSLGENILLDFNPHDFEIGTVFKIGNSEIEITEKCTICNHLSVFHKKLPKLLRQCRGLYCKILEDGIIKKDVNVSIKD
ncbi:MAG: MOSC domain-containing protein [Sulfurovum sp.]|jgi:MOSC domain-containing protein YiiM